MDNLDFLAKEIQKRNRELINFKLSNNDKNKIEVLEQEMGELSEVYPVAYCIIHSCVMNPFIKIVDEDIELLIRTINKFRNNL